MAKNTQSWGRDTARKRYADGGGVEENTVIGDDGRRVTGADAMSAMKAPWRHIREATENAAERTKNSVLRGTKESRELMPLKELGRKSGGRLDKTARRADGGKTPTPKGDVKPVQIGPPQFGDTAGRIIAARTSGSRAAVERAVKDNRKTMYGED